MTTVYKFKAIAKVFKDAADRPIEQKIVGYGDTPEEARELAMNTIISQDHETVQLVNALTTSLEV